jgi:hypothetical protein
MRTAGTSQHRVSPPTTATSRISAVLSLRAVTLRSTSSRPSATMHRRIASPAMVNREAQVTASYFIPRPVTMRWMLTGAVSRPVAAAPRSRHTTYMSRSLSPRRGKSGVKATASRKTKSSCTPARATLTSRRSSPHSRSSRC